MRRLGLVVILAAFVFSIGGPWPLLQGIAWANMLRDYAQLVPFDRAVEMTFSGEYPCPICQMIAQKKQSENTRLAAIFKVEKFVAVPGAVALRLPAFVSPQSYFARVEVLRTRADAPPTPPPRAA